MGRPTVLTPRHLEAIARLDGPGVTLQALHARLAAEGLAVSVPTLSRRLRPGGRGPKPKEAGAPPGVRSLVREAGAAIEGDDLGALRATRDGVKEAIERWMPLVGVDPRAVRALAALVKVNEGLTRSIVELAPRPEGERYAPLESAALDDLLARAESAESSATRSVERLATFERLLAEGRLVTAE